MEMFQVFATMSLFVGAMVLLSIIDKRYNLGLNGSSSDVWYGFGSAQEKTVSLAEKNKEIEELKERIQILERIVTDPAEQLKKDIDAL